MIINQINNNQNKIKKKNEFDNVKYKKRSKKDLEETGYLYGQKRSD